MQILESFKQLMYAIEGTGVWFFVYPNIPLFENITIQMINECAQYTINGWI